jgi:hypothetical protein
MKLEVFSMTFLLTSRQLLRMNFRLMMSSMSVEKCEGLSMPAVVLTRSSRRPFSDGIRWENTLASPAKFLERKFRPRLLVDPGAEARPEDASLRFLSGKAVLR